MDRYCVKPGSKVKLSDYDPNDKSAWKGDKDSALAALEDLTVQLDGLQDLLYAERKHKVLIVLQGMDSSGKDGIIRHVFEGVNPQGVKVASFKVPSPIEADHDYLWRIHQQVPGKGEIVIFNRSHYEDVLVVRVHNLVPQDEWMKRYQQINNFEQSLIQEGTTILKFYLSIDNQTQKERLQERLDDPIKRWKFSTADLNERKLWNQYKQAYEDVLNKTSTEWAPWYIVPSNHNWYRNLVVASVLVNTLKNLDMKYPEPVEDLSQVKIV
jgi:PPK2 family polyphosphate:nucleotide phosphotransferase